jgi:hypothetical protein
MMHAATRMVAPSFVFGLAAAHFLPEEDITSKASSSMMYSKRNKIR